MKLSHDDSVNYQSIKYMIRKAGNLATHSLDGVSAVISFIQASCLSAISTKLISIKEYSLPFCETRIMGRVKIVGPEFLETNTT